VGTIVENLARDVFDVESSNDAGRTWATLALRADQLLVLRHNQIAAA
jgi:Domain of unknown function (DUF4926)